MQHLSRADAIEQLHAKLAFPLFTEVGRQPWIIYGVMRTSEAVTPMPGLILPFITFTVLYFFLAAITVWLLFRQVVSTDSTEVHKTVA